MADSNKLILIIGAGAGAYLLYNYGVSQGWWSSLTGPSLPTTVLTAAQQQALITQATAQGLTSAQIQTLFTQIQAAATACGANWNPSTGICNGTAPLGTNPGAVITQGTPTTPTTQITSSGTPTSTAPVASTPPAPPATPTPAGITAAQLLSAAGISSSATLDADQWNYYETQLNPQAVTTDFSAQGWNRNASNTTTNPGVTQLTAAQYITLRQSAGLSGWYDPTGYNNTVPRPFALVTDQDQFGYAYGDSYSGI
jgi:hypothetical protein